MKKTRRDVLRSQESIKQAFIQLCIAHDTSKITVNQILEIAEDVYKRQDLDWTLTF